MEDLETLINSWLLNDFQELNNNLLERTTILYRPSHTMDRIELVINKTKYYKDPIISPVITLSVNSDEFKRRFSSSKITEVIGNIIVDNLNAKILDKILIRNSIINSLGSDIVGVNIDDMIDDTVDVISSNRSFSLKKRLTYTGIVVYDFDVIIKRVY
jgi:hypothetical protein